MKAKVIALPIGGALLCLVLNELAKALLGATLLSVFFGTSADAIQQRQAANGSSSATALMESATAEELAANSGTAAKALEEMAAKSQDLLLAIYDICDGTPPASRFGFLAEAGVEGASTATAIALAKRGEIHSAVGVICNNACLEGTRKAVCAEAVYLYLSTQVEDGGLAAQEFRSVCNTSACGAVL